MKDTIHKLKGLDHEYSKCEREIAAATEEDCLAELVALRDALLHKLITTANLLIAEAEDLLADQDVDAAQAALDLCQNPTPEPPPPVPSPE